MMHCVRAFSSLRVTAGVMTLIGVGVAVMVVGMDVASAAPVAPAPAWSVQALAGPTDFLPGDESGLDHYEAFFTNSGGEATNKSKITIVDTLPDGLVVKNVELKTSRQVFNDFGSSACKTLTSGEVSTVTCTLEEGALPGAEEPATLNPSEALLMVVHVKVPPPPFSGPLENHVKVEGGGAGEASATSHNQATDEEARAGLQEFDANLTGPDGKPTTDADSHPYQYTTSFAVNLNPSPPGSELLFTPAGGNLKDIEVALPPGLIGNPTSVERCTAQQFTTLIGASGKRGGNLTRNECPDGSAVGVVNVQQEEGTGNPAALVPLYNLVPPKGMPAQLAFQPVLGVPIYIDTRLRSNSDYGISGYVRDVTEVKRVTAARVTIWGTPADPSHDPLRGFCAQVGGLCPAKTAERPFLRLPSSCAASIETTMSVDTWTDPGAFLSGSSVEPAPTACGLPDFSPTIEAKPTTGVADSPSGLDVDVHLPQAAHEDPEGLGEADLRDATVTLPEGLLVNPASADGLAGCSEQQVGYEGVREGRQSFSAVPAECPDASKLGTVEVDTPLLDHPLPGAVYLARQGENPFGSLLAIYITVNDPVSGVVVKLPGEVEPNSVTGQLTTTVLESPQLPFEDFKLDFFEGVRAPLRTPATCGAFATTTSLMPWTAPESGAPATPTSAFVVNQAPGGAVCAHGRGEEPNSPSFEAGALTLTAGVFSPLVVRLGREDASQNFSQISVTLPPGETGKLAGIPKCSDAEIAVAQARNHPGEGVLEAVSPSCPASSAIGTVTVGAGAGPNPFHVMGQAYLAGPYKGAPFSAVFITPAIAGPFDLGVVVVRAGLYIDPATARVTTKSDPIPSILQGIPLDVRSIAVTVDRSQFILNPTNCNPLTVTGEEVSTLSQTAPLSTRFQVGACQNLKFTPRFTVSTTGSTSKAKGASLSVKVAYPAGSVGSQANIGRVDLQLPKQLPARLSTLQKACTEAQFNANPAGCPVASMIGTAKAITPLLSSPLTGPAILVSHGGAAFPDVEFLLQGEGVMVVLDGKTQIKKGITYSHFETVPDQPITLFETTFPEGPYSVLATNLPVRAKNSLCGQALTLPTTLTAQNGAVIKQTTKATITGCAKTKTLTRAQKLTKALKACHRDKKRVKRETCQKQVRKRYGPTKKKASRKKSGTWLSLSLPRREQREPQRSSRQISKAQALTRVTLSFSTKTTTRPSIRAAALR